MNHVANSWGEDGPCSGFALGHVRLGPGNLRMDGRSPGKLVEQSANVPKLLAHEPPPATGLAAGVAERGEGAGWVGGLAKGHAKLSPDAFAALVDFQFPSLGRAVEGLIEDHPVHGLGQRIADPIQNFGARMNVASLVHDRHFGTDQTAWVREVRVAKARKGR